MTVQTLRNPLFVVHKSDFSLREVNFLSFSLWKSVSSPLSLAEYQLRVGVGAKVSSTSSLSHTVTLIRISIFTIVDVSAAAIEYFGNRIHRVIK